MRISLVMLSKSFRAAFEGQRDMADNLYLGAEKFSCFPDNCCDYSSLFICKYLFDRNFCRDSRIVAAEMVDNPVVRHEWVNARGFTIDLTADQFKGGPSVICKRKSFWHISRFRVRKIVPFDPEFLSDFGVQEAKSMVPYYQVFEKTVDRAVFA